MLKNPSEGLVRVAALNAALWLFAKGKADSVEDAFRSLNG